VNHGDDPDPDFTAEIVEYDNGVTIPREKVDESVTAEGYPADCEISDTELRRMKVHFNADDTKFGRSADTDVWPPRDENGDAYAIDFTLDDLQNDGYRLSHGSADYFPFSGNRSPTTTDHPNTRLCNAPLKSWRSRYPNIRFCGRSTGGHNRDYCWTHRARKDMAKKAQELTQTGLFSHSLDNFYQNIDPYKRLLGWGAFESLMDESSYEFGVEYETREFDFTDADVTPPSVDAEVIDVDCGYPTQHTDPSLALFVAAMMSIQMISVQPKIMEESADGQGMMEEQSVEYAQLTAPPSEHDPSPQTFETLETWSEHHLNLPLSRLVTDRPKLLKRGGVDPSPDDGTEDIDASNVVLEVEAEAEDLETADVGGTDPNIGARNGAVTQTETEYIVEKTSEDT